MKDQPVVHSVDQKVILKIDSGFDVNAINRKTFETLFLDGGLTPSQVILQNSPAFSQWGNASVFSDGKARNIEKIWRIIT